MQLTYATLPDRIKAAFIDAVILIAMMYGASELFSLFESVPDYLRIMVFAFIFILYDPIFISTFGGTIGHLYNNILVKRDTNPSKNILFPHAVLRFIFKFLLGWISLLTTTGNEKRKAIHDYIANSIVIEDSK
ncbi:RDD family protein [uncultured Marixanthomonas sp.]|uniref:RDD family protein n=1 Tax=uncultured Marixanthomonas sp. TaxID=757245 RepID=UPI0030D9050F|tara:strand:+ start:841 stop:1239 length:399 start_codon:yes stop_codon:yes gene_type:complete